MPKQSIIDYKTAFNGTLKDQSKGSHYPFVVHANALNECFNYS